MAMFKGDTFEKIMAAIRDRRVLWQSPDGNVTLELCEEKRHAEHPDQEGIPYFALVQREPSDGTMDIVIVCMEEVDSLTMAFMEAWKGGRP